MTRPGFTLLVPILALLLASPAGAREPERVHLSGSHWDGSGTLQLVHPTPIARGAGYAGGWAMSSRDVRWSNEPFARTGGFGLQAGWAPFQSVRLEAGIPAWASLERQDAQGDPFSSSGLGDLQLGGTVPIALGSSSVGLAVAPRIGLGTGDAGAATGGSTTGGVLVALGGRTAPGETLRGLPSRGVGWRLNAGWHGGGAPEASGAALGVGADASLAPGVLLGGELTTLFRDNLEGAATNTPNPVDAHAYVTFGIDEHLLGTLAGGAGFGEGEGSPDWRVLFAVGWRAAGTDADPDGDGVLGTTDLCPSVPEEAWGDGDGCPDPDEDGDGVPDAVDRCPTEPEDDDGYADRDGCPEGDNDLDGLLDENDACPYEKGPLETQGCPDFDADGLSDATDECPDEPGPARSFGCPDLDGDQVPDYRDACPSEPDAEDADPLRSTGCEDLAYPVGDRIEITQDIHFEFGKAQVTAESKPVLQAVARVLERNTDLRLVEVAGHTDSVGSARSNQRLSERRAAAVRAALITLGVAPERLVSKGYGEALPTDTNISADGRAFNRRVEFLIQEVRGLE